MEFDFKMKNILFIIPHPDDEIVGSCCIIRRYIRGKKNIFLFFVTNGVISEKSSWFLNKKQIKNMIDVRKKEMKLSVKKLGVKNIFFQNIYTRTLKDKIFETYIKIRKIIVSKKIDALFCPAYEGGHQDHDVSNFICSKLKEYCKVFEFPEYNYFNNTINCNKFIKNDNNLTICELTEEEKEFKKNCLKIYKSEKKNLNFININTESFRPLKDYDYSKPAHSGVLFYRRFSFFSWHPRVDGDKPGYVCRKIIESKIFK